MGTAVTEQSRRVEVGAELGNRKADLQLTVDLSRLIHQMKMLDP